MSQVVEAIQRKVYEHPPKKVNAGGGRQSAYQARIEQLAQSKQEKQESIEVKEAEDSFSSIRPRPRGKSSVQSVTVYEKRQFSSPSKLLSTPAIDLSDETSSEDEDESHVQDESSNRIILNQPPGSPISLKTEVKSPKKKKKKKGKAKAKKGKIQKNQALVQRQTPRSQARQNLGVFTTAMQGVSATQEFKGMDAIPSPNGSFMFMGEDDEQKKDINQIELVSANQSLHHQSQHQASHRSLAIDGQDGYG